MTTYTEEDMKSIVRGFFVLVMTFLVGLVGGGAIVYFMLLP